MKKLFLFAFAALALVACSNDDNTTPDPSIHDKYQGGFYVLNEGSGSGSINYFSDGKWQLNIFQANNADQKLGMTGTVGVCSADNMYIVTKMTPFLVEVGLSDFAQKSALSSDLGQNAQAHGFALLDGKRGILTATSGAYIVHLDPLTLGDRFCTESIGIAEGDVCVFNGHILVIADGKVMAYNESTLKFEKEVCEAVTGFAQTGGAVWAAAGSKLMKIDGKLAVTEIDLGSDMPVYYNSMAYSPTCLHASKSGDAIYFTQQIGSGWSIYGRDIYRYTLSDGKISKFFEAPEGYVTYGAGVNVNPRSGDLYLVYKREGWGENSLYNDIYVVDAAGKQKQRIAYTTENETVYWFPSMVIFR